MQLETNRENTKLTKVSESALFCCDFDLTAGMLPTKLKLARTYILYFQTGYIDGKTPGTADPGLKNRILCSECNTGTENRAAAILLIGLWR
jgi:hypothetical protein